jgi:hypothetical protein
MHHCMVPICILTITLLTAIVLALFGVHW